jgi:D-3-phosphoglycerate dehydrogenase
MQVGQDQDGENNIIFLRTDTSIPDHVLEELRALPLINTVTPLEL